MISAAQLRMARAALHIGVRELAVMSGVTANTISRIEQGFPARDGTLEAIRAALESAGVLFIDENGEGPGVRLRKDVKREGFSAENSDFST